MLTKVIEYGGVDVVIQPTDWRKCTRLKVQILGCYLLFVLFGLAEQTLGTLLPKLQNYYTLNDLMMSFTYVLVCSGYFTMAGATEFVHLKLGVRGIATLGVMSLSLAYLVVLFRPPYVVFMISYIFVGFGFGGLDAAINGWMGQLVDANELLGILHGCYGLGCMILPPVVTYLIHNTSWEWNDYYLVLSVIASIALLITLISFVYETPAKFAYLKEQQRTDDQEPPTLKELATTKIVVLIGLSLFVYIGGEVAFGQWLVSYFIRVKGLLYLLSSWLSTSFWGGLTVGRVSLGFVTARYFLSPTMANRAYIYTQFVFFVLFVAVQALATHPNSTVIAIDFVIVFIAGFFVGPVFPTTIMSIYDLVPPRLQTAAMGFICAFGGGGGATLPFVVGLVSKLSSKGLATMPVIVTATIFVLLVLWTYVCLQRHVTV